MLAVFPPPNRRHCLVSEASERIFTRYPSKTSERGSVVRDFSCGGYPRLGRSDEIVRVHRQEWGKKRQWRGGDQK
jgi:hypothetical protein